MKFFNSFLFLFIYFHFSFGQHELGIKASGGVSQITNHINSPGTKQTLYFSASGQGGFFYSFHLGSKSILNVELSFTQIESREKLEIPYLDSYGNPTGQYLTDELWRHISYLSLPLFYSFKFKKLSFNLGGQFSLYLTSSGREKGPTWDNRFNKLNVDPYDFGARAGIMFQALKHFSVEANYYFGLNNILSSDVNIPNWYWRVQQINLGIRYSLIKKTK